MKMARNLVLLKLFKPKSLSDTLEIPDQYKERVKEEAVNLSTKGTAVAVGPDCELVKEGDFCFWRNYVGNSVEDDSLDGLHIVVSEDDIMCVR